MLNPLSKNVYSYVQNNPVNFRDPSGKWAVGLAIEESMGLIVGDTKSLGVYVDDKFNVMVGITLGAGSELGAVVAGGITFYWAPSMTNVNQFLGWSTTSGGSGGELISGGVEINYPGFNDFDSKPFYTVNVSLSVGTPVEGHFVYSYTWEVVTKSFKKLKNTNKLNSFTVKKINPNKLEITKGKAKLNVSKNGEVKLYKNNVLKAEVKGRKLKVK